ncbi:Three prime repair exonuclease 2 [Frankliniella fusca]|uniref:Three prime repair exonuclease 2 n=1 Tax=Frankliniella fusca TaxID=407009 RepID=A0AAE1LM38_9NEOP|nr:Three prime repair exonuclease 2 [Frankliniella fusca]
MIQIAAKFGEKEFSVFIPPSKKKFPSAVSDLTGIFLEGGEVFYKNSAVVAVPARPALSQFIDFLSKLEADIILVAHNGMSYDFPILFRDLKSMNLVNEFTYPVKYLVDAIDVLKRQLPHRVKAKQSFKQTELAEHFNLSTEDAHNALQDVKILHNILMSAKVDLVHDMQKRKITSVSVFLKNGERLAMAPLYKESLQCLHPAVTPTMISKLAQSGISLEVLKEAYSKGTG